MKTAQSAITRVFASIGIGILLYFVVGFGGCVVRIVTNSGGWIEGNSPGSVWSSYTQEAIIAFFFVIAIGVFSALKTIFEPQLSANTNKSISFGVKVGLIAFPLAAIIVFGFAGFSSETKTESKTGRFYTIVNPSGINLKGNYYSKNDTIEILEETENAICLKLPSGRECFPTPFVLQKTGKTNIRTLLDDGNVNTKTVQNKQVVTTGMSAFLGNLFVSLLIAFIAAISTIFISNYISSATPEQQTGLGLNLGSSQTTYSSTSNNSPPTNSTGNYSTSSSNSYSMPNDTDTSQIKLTELGKQANAKLGSLKKDIQSLAKQLQINFPVDYIEKEIQKTIDVRGTKLLINTAPLDQVVTNLTQKATNDKNNLDKANNLFQKAFSLYSDILQQYPQKTNDLQYYLELLNNQQIKSLLPQRKWNDYYDALNLIIKELESSKPEAEAFRILGLPLTATDEQIEKRVRSLRIANAPDNKNEEDREFFDDKVKEINEAYNILKNRKK